ncbi:MAG: peptide chain release factor 2 [Candidatus Saccharimonadales bacterium]
MHELQKRSALLRDAVLDAMNRLSLPRLKVELDDLALQISQPDFWNDSAHAQEVAKLHARIDARLAPWLKLESGISEITEMIELGDSSLQADLESQLDDYQSEFNRLKDELKFAGPYDTNDVLVSIHAGAGGTDAQDWAQMLYRMYVRWAEQHKITAKLVDQSVGEEAGLKSVTFELTGNYLYGKLKGEHGVHRLVRLSPFNADNLRQTSFAKVDIMPKIDRPETLIVDEKDLKIDVFRSGGHGGQSVNTTDSAVRITHVPTNIVIVIQNERSQLQNRETAMTILRSRLVQLQLEQHAADLQEIKGPNEQAAWGNQIRSYVLHPYKQVKDLRTKFETSDAEGVLNGALDPFIAAYIEFYMGNH